MGDVHDAEDVVVFHAHYSRVNSPTRNPFEEDEERRVGERSSGTEGAISPFL